MAAPADAQTVAQGVATPYPLTVFVQAADARFDSYFYAKKIVFSDRRSESIEDFFFIPHPRSVEREREFAAWRRQFRFILSAATFSDSVKAKIALVKDEFGRAEDASECWSIDYSRERRITVTVIGSASASVIRKEYEDISRLFLVSPTNFACKYTGRPTP
jgi:hypothetical protein